MKKLFMVILLLAITLTLSVSAEALTIGSFSGLRSRAPLDSGSGELSQETLRNALLGKGYTILPGIDTITLGGLSGVDIFFTSVFTNDLSASEAAAIDEYYHSGGSIFLQVNSAATERGPGNSLLNALGVATFFNGSLSSTQSSTGGTISSIVNNPVTNGPNGDLRGLAYGTTITSAITLGGDGAVAIAITDELISMALYEPGAGHGKLFMAGDPFTFDLFTNSLGGYYNINNLNLALNVFDQVAVPEPATLLLLGFGLLGLWGFRRKYNK